MKEILKIFKYWRSDVVVLLLSAAMLLLFCEAESIKALLMTKVAGFALGAAAYWLLVRWSNKGLMEEEE